MSYADVLKGAAKVGRRVAVVGAGGIGFDVSDFLTHYPYSDDETLHDDPLPPKVDEVSDLLYVTSLCDTQAGVKEFLDDWGITDPAQHRGGLNPKTKTDTGKLRKVYLLQRKSDKFGATLGKTTGISFNHEVC